MKKTLPSILIFTIAGGVLWAASAAQTTKDRLVAGEANTLTLSQPEKVAVVNISQVYQDSPKVQAAQARLKESADNAGKELQIMLDEEAAAFKELQELGEKMNNPSLSPETRAKIQEEGQAKQQALFAKKQQIERYKVDMTQTLRQREQEMVTKHVAEIRTVIAKYAKEHGIDIVYNSTGMEEGAGPVLYADERFDLTSDISKIVNRGSGTLTLPAPDGTQPNALPMPGATERK